MWFYFGQISSPKKKLKKETTTTHGKLPQRWKTVPEIFFKVIDPHRRNSFYKKKSGVEVFQATKFPCDWFVGNVFLVKSDPIRPKSSDQRRK